MSVLAVPVAAGVHALLAPVEVACSAAQLTSADRDRLADLPAWRVPQYVASRALLRALLAEVVGARAARMPLGVRAGGQPFLVGLAQVGVSLSHTPEAVAVAVGVGHTVGVDVEQVAAVGDAMLRRCCTPPGRRLLISLAPEQRAEAFTWIWAAQEACVKATGEGFAGRPWRVPVEPGQPAGRWGAVRWRRLHAASTPPAVCAYVDRTVGRHDPDGEQGHG